MPTPITAAMLYDLVHCPHRVAMDLFGDPSKRDAVSPFVELLWEKGTLYEKEVMASLEVPFLDLSPFTGDEKVRRTMEAMRRGEPLIYNGRIQADGLIGVPDLLRREGEGYVPGDIKSGTGEEGPEDDRKPKKHYGVQLALYVDILERLDLSASRRGFVWDIQGDEVPYDLTAPKGPRTPESLWDDYQGCLAEARTIIGDSGGTLPAYAGVCKQCHWFTACLEEMHRSDDLTLVPGLGRAARDNMLGRIGSIHDLAAVDPEAFISGKKTVFPGLGPDRLRKFHARAKLLSTGGTAYLTAPVSFPAAERELFFDIEHDPMRGRCYLHGFVERTVGDNATERYVYFLAEEPTAEAEERAFSEAVAFIRDSQPCAVYYYSKYERTVYRLLRGKYPHVIGEDELEGMFDPARSVDLYFDVVLKSTEWPTSDFSIKTLAKHLGFEWRDAHPSGAASIEWFHRWVETHDASIRQRILDYNEDDCRATRVLLDGIRNLPMG